jgi:hypothetical protein
MAKLDSISQCVEIPETGPELTLWALEHKKYGDHVLNCLRKVCRRPETNKSGPFYSTASKILREVVLHMMHTFPHAVRILPLRNFNESKKYSIYCANVFMLTIDAKNVDNPDHRDYEIVKWIEDNVKFE